MRVLAIILIFLTSGCTCGSSVTINAPPGNRAIVEKTATRAVVISFRPMTSDEKPQVLTLHDVSDSKEGENADPVPLKVDVMEHAAEHGATEHGATEQGAK